ncbi:hypothetical protein JCM33374_g1594 [Metschnikowia sp. JCM 33374]|nr:hypothetical protein JCM33374_g1594 [Metschnikowia sp. JCM 33374]
MASSSSKKIASTNANTLKELHLISLGINVLVLLFLFIFNRPASKWKYIVFSLPSFGCQFVLEKSGRPVFATDQLTGNQKLVRAGDDIKGPGLFEYMFDCIYITWLCDLLMIIFGSNKVWLLYLVIPVFVAYKVSSIARSFLGKNSTPGQPVSGAAEDPSTSQGKSKRQAKLEKRGQQSQRVRMR